MKRRDTVLLAVAYVLLVVTNVVAWNKVDDSLINLEKDVCLAAELGLAANAGLLEVFAGQEGVDPVAYDEVIEFYEAAFEQISEDCVNIEEGLG
jgi:hypothetical protein